MPLDRYAIIEQMVELDFQRPNLLHKKTLGKLNDFFLPYADTAYGTLLTWWDLYDDLYLAELNGNIVVRSSYPSEGEHQDYMLIGAHDAVETVSSLFKYLDQQGLPQILRFTPEYTVDALAKDKEGFDIRHEPDISEYLLSVQEQVDLPGKQFALIRSKVNQLNRSLSDKAVFKELDLSDTEIVKKLIHCEKTWAKTANNDQDDSESIIIKRSLELYDEIGMKCFGITIGDELLSFALFKPLGQKHANINHIKVNNAASRHIFTYTVHQLSVHLQKEYGFEYMNIEQDLGIPGLRIFKQLLRPVKMLNKYTVSRSKS